MANILGSYSCCASAPEAASAAASASGHASRASRSFHEVAFTVVLILMATNRHAMLPEPLLQHHQDPDHGPIVVRVALDVHAGEPVDELRAHDVPRSQVGQAVERELAQRLVRLQPPPEGQAEAVL